MNEPLNKQAIYPRKHGMEPVRSFISPASTTNPSHGIQMHLELAFHGSTKKHAQADVICSLRVPMRVEVRVEYGSNQSLSPQSVRPAIMVHI